MKATALSRHRVLVGLALLPWLLCACLGPGRPTAEEALHVIVLHTNDVHGQVEAKPFDRGGRSGLRGGLPRIATYVNQVRREAADWDAELLVVDAGDWFQGTPEGALDQGLAYVRALSGISYDAMAVGNHEFDHGLDVLHGLLEQADLPAVCANVVGLEGPDDLRFLELDGGRFTVALPGLLTPETRDITHADARTRVEFEEPAEVLRQLREDVEADWWLPLTHMGVAEDRLLAAAHPDLPLIVGGHSHTFLPEGVMEGNVLLVQAGHKALVCGRVDLWFDRETKECIRKEAQLIELEADPEPEYRNPVVNAACAEMLKRSAAAFAEEVGTLAGPLERSRTQYQSSSAGNFVADLCREAHQADIGLMNRGGLRSDVDQGSVTLRDLYELCPFDNNVCLLELKGDVLTEMLRKAIEGTGHSGLETSGLTLEVYVDDEQGRLVGIRVSDQILNPERTYRVAMNSFMARGGDGYLDPEVGGAAIVAEDPRLLREILEERFRRANEPIVPPTENRYRIIR